MTLEDRAELAGALNAGLAHDLRNLLAVAETSVFIAKRKLDDRAALEHHLDRTSTALRAAQELVSTTLAFARGEPLVTETRPLLPLLEAVRGTFGPDVAAKVALDVDPPELMIVSSLALLKAAILNLVKNATEAVAAGGAVRVIGRASNGYVEIAVEDDGPGFIGVDEPTLGGVARSSKPGGTGLGLATARACARVHGGELAIERPARGACVVFRVPGAG